MEEEPKKNTETLNIDEVVLFVSEKVSDFIEEKYGFTLGRKDILILDKIIRIGVQAQIRAGHTDAFYFYDDIAGATFRQEVVDKFKMERLDVVPTGYNE